MKPHIYFPNLNGLRFIAVSMVVCYHIEYAKKTHGLNNLFFSNTYGIYLGGLGVTLFFCLSGFLITYILLAEKQRCNSINLKNFYIRRALRIWPLYFLVIFLAFFVLNNIDFFIIKDLHEKANQEFLSLFLFYLFLVPNFLVFNSMPYATQAWSIGVEEQFYLLWPLLIRSCKNLGRFLCYSLTTFFILYGLADFVLPRILDVETAIVIRYLLTNCRFDCMIVGALAAYALFNKRHLKLIHFFYQKEVQIITYIVTITLLITQPVFPGHGHLVYAICFTILILNLADNHNSIISMENRRLDYLGKVSYGIYMLHPIAIQIALKVSLIFAPGLQLGSPVTFNVSLYMAAFFLSIAMAAISYAFFEKVFLNRKEQFSTITTGDDVVHR